MRILIAMTIALGACGNAEPTYELRTEPCAPEMPAWILDCVEKANPHADEEPEDNTAQCEDTAARLFCGPTCTVSAIGHIKCRVSL